MLQRLLDLLTDLRKALVFSVMLHVLVAVVLMLIKVSLDITPPAYAEINFVSSQVENPTPTPAPMTEAKSNIPPEPPAQEAQPEESASKPEQTKPIDVKSSEPVSPPVNLPERLMREQEETEPIRRNADKLALSQGRIEAMEQRQGTQRDTPQTYLPKRLRREKRSASPQQISVADRGIVPETEIGGPDAEQPFTIEGEAAERDIVKKVIPEYPEALQKEAVIRIRFSVLPDGRVGQMIPMKKDNPRLEELTMASLKQWRFNPLSPQADQSAVQGVITFRYELQ